MAWFAALPVAGAPGAAARYCSAGAIAVGRIVERAAGVPLPRFAERALFAPLGIAPSHVKWRFQLDSGARDDYAQAWLRPRDMTKIGVLARNGGRWNGRQVVPAAWLRRSTARHATLGARGYGYFWWQQYFDVPGPNGVTRVDTYLASGNGGQKIFVVPTLEAVVVFTGGAYNVESATADIMVRDVLPAVLARRR
jgi:CubicO group peptidase (beta-lactamase class C family)